MASLNKLSLIIIGLMTFSLLTGQQVPSKPFSYPIYAPQLLNPAITGSKDFTNINLILRVNGSPGAQLLSYNSRLAGQNTGSALYPEGITYSNFGLGGYMYQDQLDFSRNLGFGISGAYHISLGEENLSALSIGLSVRGTYNIISDEGETASDKTNVFNPNFDLGIYYYGPSAFAGLSTINLLGTKTDSVMTYENEAYIPREYNFFGGYKFILSRKNAIILEPSILISASDSTLSEIHKQITPYLKLYLQNFYIGTYYKDKDHLSLFFQYQFPRFFTGLFVEFPRTGFLTSDNIIIELSLGLNLGKDKRTFSQTRHW